ncbi:hypothetical protein PGB34_13440 [Xenophilus arseniciresistens]|uniref:Uncharacterized protein n=1 Tax=Xenophilus arseniciresistens TaxID=1283306 RepID=A0AAE3N9N1_9BURK|nr:hypothetical protein [Xenophilus arseniciresistens]MDA7417368.1 hypothetical protein [Xenophilus arseniciresistens]
MTETDQPRQQLMQIGQALAQVRQQPATLGQLCDTARQAHALQAALPPRFSEVLLNLLDRLESSALFSEESCSFSQKDLLDSLQLWGEKAGERLAAR